MHKYDSYYPKVKELYRELHKYPELNFDLYKTVEIVKKELESYGIAYTEKYCKSSVVAEVGKGEKCIAIRADMDALPIQEKSGVEFTSAHDGNMHACGHDSHTAILLGVAKYFKDNESALNMRVRFIFQPSEEGTRSGAKIMVENGVMDGVDEIIATHCTPAYPTNQLGFCPGPAMASCVSINLAFLGKSAHATAPALGVDAIKMTNDAFLQFENAVKELAQTENQKYIWSVGVINGGTANNIICDRCELKITFRFYERSFAEKMEKITRDICEDVAKKYGGDFDLDWHYGTRAVINDEGMSQKLKELAEKAGYAIRDVVAVMGSEDFGEYLTKSKGFIFRFGNRDEETGCTYPLHSCNFKMHEPAMMSAFTLFCDYVLYKNSQLK